MATSSVSLFIEPRGRLFTVADLAAMPTHLPSGDIDFELDEGRLIVMVPPGRVHAATQVRFAAALFEQGEKRGLGQAFTEVAVVLSRRPDTVVAPDAAFVAAAKLPVRESPEGYLETIPDLVVEVRSKNDTAAELDRKVAQYLAAGVRVVLVADPAVKTITVYRSGDEPKICARSETLALDDVIPGFRLNVGDVFPA